MNLLILLLFHLISKYTYISFFHLRHTIFPISVSVSSYQIKLPFVPSFLSRLSAKGSFFCVFTRLDRTYKKMPPYGNLPYHKAALSIPFSSFPKTFYFLRIFATSSCSSIFAIFASPVKAARNFVNFPS